MGVVYLAEQEKPVRRKVALKIIKKGLDSKDVITRFEAERQALALMDHPNIAKVLDAGTTLAGTPYFAMELVKGVPISEFCDVNKVSIDERLRLFVSVCKAIQHAHQKGVIHRDLKPSNVLVTIYDGDPVPKVIDFGLAKAMAHTTRLTDKTIFTEFGQVVGTLQYMSPEQAEMNEMAVDTRTDIYSLGVILYELLTGSTPLDKEAMGKNAIFKVLEMIREQEPPLPSKRMSTISNLGTTGVSRQRQISPNRLQQILAGELDWIVMKAISKESSQRYESAGGFGDDIARYLRKDPVLARPPTLTYRLKKLTVKYWAISAIAASAICMISIASVVSIVAAIAANNSLQVAEAQTEIASEQTEITFSLVSSLIGELQESIKDIPQSEMIRSNLISAALEELSKMTKLKSASNRITRERAKAYFQIGSLLTQFANISIFFSRRTCGASIGQAN